METTLKKRIGYIDAIRGFTMILVVLNHVSGFCLNINSEIQSVNHIIKEFRMPLFFFICGFVLQKNYLTWTYSTIESFLKKKFPIQIISTSLFLYIYTYLNNISFIEGLYSDSKMGFWFTYVLFIFYIFYSIIMGINHYLNIQSKYADLIISCIGVLFYLFLIPSIYNKIHLDDNIKNLLSLRHWGYFTFFVGGTLVKKHFDIFTKQLDKKRLITISLLLFLAFNIFRNDVLIIGWTLFNLITAITGIIIFFSFFRYNSDIIDNSRLGFFLKYIGKNTLSIYFLHYFFLPINFHNVFSVFSQYPMPIIEFSFSLFISIIIIIFCLLVNNIICISPTISYLLGKKTINKS